MKKSTFLGSTLSVLLLFSVITYSRSLVQQQNPKSNQQTAQTPVQPATDTVTTTEAITNPVTSIESAPDAAAATATTGRVLNGESYMATAYSLRGRTASGAAVAHGMIAADPRVLPIGSRVRIEAGSYSGEYLVADTGGAVRGKRIDIWTPTSREAMRFGRRTVKLTVLQLGGKRAKAASTRQRTIGPAAPAPQSPGFYWPGKPQL
jgi:3D (Asp-Asp-Asp) domain-containing protein